MDMEKERNQFESLPQIKGILAGGNVYFSTLSMNYTSKKPALEHCVYFINGAWYAWQEKVKAQAVPVWISTDFMLPDEDEAVLFMDKNNVVHDGYLSTDYVDGPYGENGEDFGGNQTLWASNSNGDEFLPNKVKYWMHRPSNPITGGSGAANE